MDSSDWSNGIRYHIIGTRPDTEFNTPLASSSTMHSVASSRGSTVT